MGKLKMRKKKAEPLPEYFEPAFQIVHSTTTGITFEGRETALNISAQGSQELLQILVFLQRYPFVRKLLED